MKAETLLQQECTEEALPRTRVCFVCTGNTCRSPMAAAVLNSLAPDRYLATSAGLAASVGSEMSGNARQALANAGIEAKAHTARQISATDLAQSDIVIGMTGNHCMILMQAFPQFASRLEVLGQDVSDPYGGDLATYEQCLVQITEALKERFSL